MFLLANVSARVLACLHHTCAHRRCHPASPQVGGNGPALKDGGFEAAAFNRPQGLAYSPARDVLYVADTESHALREVNLRTKTVRTLAGALLSVTSRMRWRGLWLSSCSAGALSWPEEAAPFLLCCS